MNASLDRYVRRLQRRTALAAWLGDWSRHLTLALFTAGAIALLARALWRLEPPATTWALAVALPTCVTAWVTARRRFLSRSGATTWLDLHTGSTGLVCTSDELDDPRWQAAVLARLNGHPPLPRLRGRRLAAPPLTAALFGAAALWVPLPEPITAPGRELFERSLARLTEKLETLEEEISIDEAAADEMRTALERIDDELGEAPAESVLEALDRMEERLGEAAEDARRRAEEALAQLGRSAPAGRDGSLAGENGDRARALAQLAELGLSSELPDLGELGALSDAEELSALQDWLSANPAALGALSEELTTLLDGKLDRLLAAGLLQSGRPSKSASELARFAELVEHECDENCGKKPGGT